MTEDLASQSEAKMQRQPRRIGLFGYFGSGNLGNDGSLEAFLQLLRNAPFPLEVTCICYAEDEVKQRFGISTLPIVKGPRRQTAASNVFAKLLHRIQNIRRAIKAARSFDAIFVPGTGILDDFGVRWSGMPYHLILWGAAARIAGTPFAFVSIGAGPIVHPVSRFLMVSAARISKFRSFRDEASKRFLAKRRAANEGDFVTPDLAFGLPVPNFAGDPDSGEKKDTGPLIGIGVMSYFGWEQRQADGHEVYQQYITKLTEFCTWLLNSGFRLRLLVGGRSDAAVIEDLLGRLKQRTGETLAGRVIAEPAQSLTELVAQMSAAELIIATRYHNVVCALISGKPVISIGYADKNDFLLQKANLGAFAQKVDTLDVELLKRQFLELYSSKSNYISNISKMIDDFKSQLEGQQVRIFNFINNS